MLRFAPRRPSGRALILAAMLFAAISFPFAAGVVIAQSDSDTPAAACGSGPAVACPDPDEPAAAWIASVTAVPDGVVLLLTEDGLSHARACGGAAGIAALAGELYATIPVEQRATFALDWTSQALIDEIYGHAFLAGLSAGIPGMAAIHERANPVNIEFADYGGPGQQSADDRAQQATFAALGAVHRAVC